MTVKKYRAIFLAGDAALESKRFHLPADADFQGSIYLLELMNKKQELEMEYGCRVFLRIEFLGLDEFPASVRETQPGRDWLGWLKKPLFVIRRVSSFFDF